MREDPDPTVRIRVPRMGVPSRGARAAPWVAGIALLAIGASGAAWWRWPAATPPVQQTAFVPPPPPAIQSPVVQPPVIQQPVPTVAPAPTPPIADEAQILADTPEQLAVYRFTPQPAVVVLQFPSLGDQASMLNRIAALIEKNGYSHSQVVSEASLNARIVADGGSPDTFYYGHDYSSADILRFLDLAADLNPDEARLRDLVQRLGWRNPGAAGAIVSLVRASTAKGLDEAGRAAILRHELSHGVYFTDPAYAEFCRHFWRDTLSADERGKFTAFLGREGYDTKLGDLIVNETQAYLMHTPDRRFFSAAEVGLPPTRVVELRQIFLVGMPPGWLRDHTAVDLPP